MYFLKTRHSYNRDHKTFQCKAHQHNMWANMLIQTYDHHSDWGILYSISCMKRFIVRMCHSSLGMALMATVNIACLHETLFGSGVRQLWNVHQSALFLGNGNWVSYVHMDLHAWGVAIFRQIQYMQSLWQTIARTYQERYFAGKHIRYINEFPSVRIQRTKPPWYTKTIIWEICCLR